MFFNQVARDSVPAVIDDFLRRAIDPPASDEDAQALMDELNEHVHSLRAEGSPAQAARTAPFLSWFWWVSEPDTWPMHWASAARFLTKNGFSPGIDNPWERYRWMRAHVRRFGPPDEVERVAAMLEETNEYGLDATVCDRLAVVARARTPESDAAAYESSRQNLELMQTSAKTLGVAGCAALKSIYDSEVTFRQPSIWWQRTKGWLRGNLQMSWTPEIGGQSPSLMLIAGDDQVQIGLHASSMLGSKGFSRRAFDLLADQGLEEVAEWMFFAGYWDDASSAAGRSPSELPSWAILGRSFTIDALATHAEVIFNLTQVAETLLPAFRLVWESEAGGTEPAAAPVSGRASSEDSLRSLAEQFVEAEAYPNDGDRRDQQVQRDWERMLAPGNLAAAPLSELRRIYNGHSYGAPGPQAILNATLADEDPTVVDRFRAAIDFLLWDTSPVAERIDRVMDDHDLGLRGFKEAAIAKFLAVAHPSEFLAVYPFTGDKGKAAILKALGQEPPPMSATVGERLTESNAALREIADPLFPGDTWGQSRFLYWLMNRTQEAGQPVADLVEEPQEDRLEIAATSLNLPREFLDEVHQLLRAHKQVVFYGPPGTGKTYVARHLAEALAPLDEHRMLVQFHPSTSYEDFFEGYRPLSTGDDQMVYKLVPGQLRIMADRAAADLTGRPHILIIDEINRANLAKVLGELLFLLEYREAEIHPLYRPTETFSLPENLWIIGTMNTADRSIATVDAALRRRFHFVPFVPDDRPENPLGGLLARWLDDNDEDSRVADLVDGVNQRLRRELGGDHLLLGPSYFMKKGLDRQSLALIWRYQIEPLVDDLFFGDTRAKAFYFDAVWAEFGFDVIHPE